MTQALLATLFPISLAAGVNLYLTIFAVGLSTRLGWFNVPGADVLASLPVLAVAATLYVLEFFADKIQMVDSLWDFIHTVVRPVGAAAIALGFTEGLDPEVSTSVALVAGGVALTSHSSKMGFRALVNTSPEPVSNVAVSTLEDISVLGLLWLVVQYPLVALGVALVIFAVLMVVTPYLFRWASFWYRSVRARFRAQVQAWDTLPDSHQERLGSDQVQATLRSRTRGVPRASGRAGYVSITADGQLHFTYGRRGLWSADKIKYATFRRGVLMNVLDVQQEGGEVRFVFLKDQTEIAKRFAGYLGASDLDTLPVTA